MALMVHKYGKPPSVILGWLFWFRPRFGILPVVLPKVSYSVVELSSRIFPSTPLGKLLLEVFNGCCSV